MGLAILPWVGAILPWVGAIHELPLLPKVGTRVDLYVIKSSFLSGVGTSTDSIKPWLIP
jgi:hypothetical protein